MTKEELLALVTTFTDADEAHATARVATLAAKDNTQSVTLVEQGLIDQAEAHYQVETTKAKSDEDAAVAVEVAAQGVEDTAKQALLDGITAFANHTP